MIIRLKLKQTIVSFNDLKKSAPTKSFYLLIWKTCLKNQNLFQQGFNL